MSEITYNLDAPPQKKTDNESGTKISKTFKKLKGIKNIEIIVAVIAVIVMLVIYFGSKMSLGTGNNNEGKQNNLITQSEDYCKKMERELAASLSKVKDAGEVSVVINWESSVESIIAYITNTGANSSTSTPQIISSNGSSMPIVLKEIYPKALGVIIICQGGDKVSVKLDIINSVSVLLGITPDKINVLTMKK